MKPLRPTTLHILEPGGAQPLGWPLLRLGFRPFYLGAAALAALAVPVWVLALLGYVSAVAAVHSVWWHAHEMLFGFVAAVIVGFLLTAGKSWANLPTPRGAALGALALLWLAARITALGGVPYAVHAVLDAALLPTVAFIFARLLVRAGNRRNYPIAAILALLAVANGVFHLAVLDLLPLSPRTPLHAGLALVVMLECIIGGRVIPGFTQSALPGVKLAALPWLERLTLGSTGLGLALWVADSTPLFTACALGVAAVCHGLRQWRWQPWATRQRPILWILHAAYAWLPLSFGLLALAQGGWVNPSLGLHGLAVGLTGGLIIGMLTRTARGHTGRSVVASVWDTTMYALVVSAAVVRVVLPALTPAHTQLAWLISGALWGIAFLIYCAVYAPWLTRTRADGLDG